MEPTYFSRFLGPLLPVLKETPFSLVSLPICPPSIPTFSSCFYFLRGPTYLSFFLAPLPTSPTFFHSYFSTPTFSVVPLLGPTFFHSYLLLCSYLRGPICLPFFSAPPPSCPIFFHFYLLLCFYLLCGPTQFPFFSAPSPTCPIFCCYLQQSSRPTSSCSSSYWLFAAFALPGPSAWNIPAPFFTLPPPRHPLNHSFKETSQSCPPPDLQGPPVLPHRTVVFPFAILSQFVML